VIDLHSHVLFGIDDGPATREASLALARDAVAAGTRTLVATPHVSTRYRNDVATIAAAAGELTAMLREEDSPLRLIAGAEVALARVHELEPDELVGLCLGDGGWLLLEPPFGASAPDLEPAVAELHSRGHRVLLAHPERCPLFYRDIGLLERLVRDGALSSVTAGSLTGSFGGAARSFALQLAEAGLIHNVASDTHDQSGRPPEIATHLRRAGLTGLSDWLTEEVPAAILAGGEIPRRPDQSISTSRRRTVLSRLRGRPTR
jgi:protein-tyrosine phosphatase